MKHSGNSHSPPDQVSMADIAVFMKDLPTSKFRLCKSDEHLTEKAMQVAFAAFLSDLGWLGETCKSDSSAVEMAVQATFANLVDAVRAPYLDIVAELPVLIDINARMDREISRLEVAQETMEATTDSLEISHRGLQDVVESKGDEIDQLWAEMEKLQTAGDEAISNGNAEIARLRHECGTLRAEKETETSELQLACNTIRMEGEMVVTEKKSEIAGLQLECKTIRAEAQITIAAKEAKINGLQLECNALRTEGHMVVAAKEAEINGLQLECNSLRTEGHMAVAAKEAEINGLRDERNQLQAQMEYEISQLRMQRDRLADERQDSMVMAVGPRLRNEVVANTVNHCTIRRGERTTRNEIHILRYITREGGHPNLPTLMSDGYDELVTSQFGAPLRPGQKKTDWAQVLLGVLDALKWLHSHDIIHRDVRWENIKWDDDHAVLTDLGTSVQLADEYDGTITYNGGYICCPRDLIGDFQQAYVALPSDDCYAFVLLVNMLLWPAFWADMNPQLVARTHSKEAAKLRTFWDAMDSSPFFKKYMEAAENLDYDTLATLADLCVYY